MQSPAHRSSPIARWLRLTASLSLLLVPSLAAATFSIVACDKAGNCGVAVATNNLAVGASVPYAQARVGALVSQFETNPNYGPKGLALLSAGKSPEAAIKALLDGDGHFDGTGIEERQVAIVDAKGHSFAYTGTDALASAWAGAHHDEGYSVQGNGLAGEAVLAAMRRAYQSTSGSLAERLMAGLEAGQDAGGQSSGKRSAALLVRTVDGGWQDIDLRIDAAAEPIPDLRRLLDQHYAHQAIIRAERQAGKGNRDEARLSIAEALRRSHGWDRIWRRAARLAMSMDDSGRALDYLGVFLSLNPAWARREMQDEIYAPLRSNAQFKAWSN
ncbi:putative Ntn-hydrolase superfamily protein [Tahibacter aquaticus]|uniref:Putative Ntn-hydrolase superfamily protein n=1 Tax=Tahibacter aquaticus TaxID=520092 RepID=A0A4R6Z7E0_9GAMM|nr:DUF1028 domain-containing protein [Tahibacter aquaticus]TDR47711.1 putative Ntn-hydrolase superfamily protein [Tahibacter aquaticus]